jgi:hypothetical protein
MSQPTVIHTEALESRKLLSASISGTAFRDANLDGVRQSSETGLAGEIVYVDANNNGKFDAGERSATSNASGTYTFTGLAAGTYRLRAKPPAGWRYDWTGPAGFFYDVTVGATSAITGKDFGNTTSSIIGKIYNDLDGGGSKSASEPVLSGRTVFLDTNENGKLDAGEKTAVSNSQGMYAFGNLPAGNYQVRELAVSGWRITQILGGAYTFYLSPDHVYRGDYGNTTHPQLSGTVFEDLNGNGIQDSGESTLSQIRVFIDTNHDGKFETGEPTALTSSTGAYVFNTLGAGTYTVRIVIPAGRAATKPVGGVTTVTLAAGQIVSGKNFGLT